MSKVLDYGVLREEISKENMLAMAELIAGKEFIFGNRSLKKMRGCFLKYLMLRL